MFEGLYNSASGMVTQARIQEVIANNISKAVVTGHKRLGVVTQPFNSELDNAAKKGSDRSELVGGVEVKQIFTVFEQGKLKGTANPLDVAIEGDGFFVIKLNNQEFLTRNGRLSMTKDGVLVNSEGQEVMGENGQIKLIDAGQTGPTSIGKISIEGNGKIFVSQPGTNERKEVGKLKIVDVEDVSQLIPVGQTLFKINNQTLKPAENFIINQGYLEESNVNILDEMVSMITNMRIYETNQKILKNMSESFARSINEIGRV